MILKYGSYSHDNNECDISIDRRMERDQMGRVLRVIETWRIGGFLIESSQAAITTAINALKTAYGTNGKDLVFYLDNGTTETSHSMKRADLLEGPSVVQPPFFPIGRGAEYATYRSYSIVVEGVFAGDDDINTLSYNETITHQGGGERWQLSVNQQGPPTRETLAEQTPYLMIQEGDAVGFNNWPAVAQPIFPALVHWDQQSISRSSPKPIYQDGKVKHREFPIRWRYIHESDAQIGGLPKLFTGS